MKIKIDETTTASQFAVFLPELVKNESLRKAAWNYFVKKDFYSLTVDEFCTLVEDGTWKERTLTASGEITLFGLVFSEDLRKFVEEFTRALKAYTIISSDTSGSSVQCSMIESMIFFCREFFGLPNFKVASEITIGDYLLAKKYDYMRTVAEKNAIKKYKQSIKK